MQEVIQVLSPPLTDNFQKLVFVILVMTAAFVVQYFGDRLIRRVWSYDNVNMPSASIFINLFRLLVWAFAISIILKPVFGIEPTAVLTALGIGGLAISLGMKDTLANIISGLQLTATRTVQPGDYVTINGLTGLITDITWRHTTIKGRLGEVNMVPNSVLNTASLVKLPVSLESFSAISFILKPDIDIDEVSKDIIDTTYKAGEDYLLDRKTYPSAVKLTRIDTYGVHTELWINVKREYSFGTAKDPIIRALKDKPYLAYFDEAIDEGDIAKATF